jgi:class 3 adenylate cyclase
VGTTSQNICCHEEDENISLSFIINSQKSFREKFPKILSSRELSLMSNYISGIITQKKRASMGQTKTKGFLRILPYTAIRIIAGLLGICCLFLILIFLLPLAVPYIHDARSFQYIKTAMSIERSISSFVQHIIPTKIAGKDMTRWIIIVVAFILYGTFVNMKEWGRSKTARLKVMRDYEELKKYRNLTDDADVLTPLKETIQNLQTANKKDRGDLLKLFAETKKKLDAMGKDLAFLAIDVVDSTGMKAGEEKAAIEYDFKEYKTFVDGRLRADGSIKSTWTPDGVMTCFNTVDEAVKAARAILNGLEDFNRNVKTIKRDFLIRCGINAGYVYFDETLPLEEMSDRVIDVAGHMQKHAPPNTICIAKPAIEPLQERDGFIPITKAVDGYEVYMSERRKVPRE